MRPGPLIFAAQVEALSFHNAVIMPTDQFVATLNVAHFKAKLMVETDAEKRRVLEVLFAEEEARLAALTQAAYAVGA